MLFLGFGTGLGSALIAENVIVPLELGNIPEPGGHTLGLKKRFVRAPGGGTAFQVLDPTPLPEEGMVPLEVEKGTLVVLHGLLPHKSGANTSSKSRHAYSVHLIEGTARYPEDNWLHRAPTMPPRGFGSLANG